MASPLKVLLFRPTLGQGGADRVTATLLRHLDRRRFRLHLALVRATGEFLAEVPDDVTVHSLGVDDLWRSVPALSRLIRRERPDVLFSTSSAANLAAVLAHDLTGRRGRCVLSERNALLRGHATWRRGVELALKVALYRRADCVTAVSAGVADELERVVRLPRKRMVVVYNPVVSREIEALASEPVDHPWFRDVVPVVLGVGRLVPQKDFQLLVRAFADVRRQRPVRLFVLGDGPLRAKLRDQAESLGVGNDVEFGGFDKNPFKYMARCAIYVQTSRAEGLPGSLIQAMACGAPSIATDCKHGPAEVIHRPGTDGFLVPVGDANAVADRMRWLLQNPGLRGAIAKQARVSAGRFSFSSSLELYSAAIAG
jgi:glycosyltransferase involved in cell wall biosynthesis